MYLIFWLRRIKIRERANIKENIFKFALGG